MINEDYCSYEVAKLLKEKGFNYQGFDYIDFEGEVIKQDRPTHQMAMKWLREVHNRFVEVCADKGYDFKSIVFRPAVYDKDLDCLWESDNYKSYEDAVEAAIKYCLENLI